MQAAEKANDGKEAAKNAELVRTIDAKKERTRIDTLHNLLDKTAVYSQFVSSQIKSVEANIQGKKVGTGQDEAKRKAEKDVDDASSRKKRGSKVRNKEVSRYLRARIEEPTIFLLAGSRF